MLLICFLTVSTPFQIHHPNGVTTHQLGKPLNQDSNPCSFFYFLIVFLPSQIHDPDGVTTHQLGKPLHQESHP